MNRLAALRVVLQLALTALHSKCYLPLPTSSLACLICLTLNVLTVTSAMERLHLRHDKANANHDDKPSGAYCEPAALEKVLREVRLRYRGSASPRQIHRVFLPSRTTRVIWCHLN